MKISDLVWGWASQKEENLIRNLFSFGEALEFLASQPSIQVERLEGKCPFIEAWYGCCCEVLDFRERLNNHSIPEYYDQGLLDALNRLSSAFENLTEEECAEGDDNIYNMDGWCKIRELSQLPLLLIEWQNLVEFRDSIQEML
ncbi:hypothetical protein [Sessilibacter sp. MAH4]